MAESRRELGSGGTCGTVHQDVGPIDAIGGRPNIVVVGGSVVSADDPYLVVIHDARMAPARREDRPASGIHGRGNFCPGDTIASIINAVVRGAGGIDRT